MFRFGLFACVVTLPGLADAGLILQPVGASTDLGFFSSSRLSLPPSLAFNQSGLSPTYVDQVDDFDAYIASSPKHDSTSAFSNSYWLSNREIGGQSGGPPGNFDFVLGGSFTIQSFALWNYNIRDFELLADDNASFTSPTLLGTFENIALAQNTAAIPAEVFSFTPTLASHVRLQITKQYGQANVGISEGAFELGGESAVVPEPSSLLLVCLSAGPLALGYFRRRRREWLSE